MSDGGREMARRGEAKEKEELRLEEDWQDGECGLGLIGEEVCGSWTDVWMRAVWVCGNE